MVVLPKPADDAPASEWSIVHARPTLLAWWLLIGVICALVYWQTLGVWVLATLSYLAGVFFVSVVNTRYFAPAWLVFLPVLVVPLDLLLAQLIRRRSA